MVLGLEVLGMEVMVVRDGVAGGRGVKKVYFRDVVCSVVDVMWECVVVVGVYVVVSDGGGWGGGGV